jgi:hypothetical protein
MMLIYMIVDKLIFLRSDHAVEKDLTEVSRGGRGHVII